MLVTQGKVSTLTRHNGQLEVERYDPVLGHWQELAKLDDPLAELRSLGVLWGQPVFGRAGELPPKASLLAESGELVPLPLTARNTIFRHLGSPATASSVFSSSSPVLRHGAPTSSPSKTMRRRRF